MNDFADKPLVLGPQHREGSTLSFSAVFLAWGPPSHTRRSELMARKLGIPLRRVHVLKKGLYLAPLRYAVQAFLTLIILFRERPSVVFVQDPPIFAGLTVCLYTWLARGPLGAGRKVGFVVDAHTGAFLHPWWKPFRRLRFPYGSWHHPEMSSQKTEVHTGRVRGYRVSP